MNRKEFISAFAHRYHRTKTDTELFLRQFQDFVGYMLENNLSVQITGLMTIGMKNVPSKQKYVPKFGWREIPPRLMPYIKISPMLKRSYTKENTDNIKIVNGEAVMEDEV